MSRLDKYSRRPASSRSANAAPDLKPSRRDDGSVRRDSRSREGGRSVPMSTVLGVAFGSALTQIGGIVLTFGMIAWWAFGSQADITSWYVFSGDLSRATGQVTDYRETAVSEGGGEGDPGTPIYHIHYEFTGPDGGIIRGDCYSTGMHFNPSGPVNIEFKPDDPWTSRIVGTRKAWFGFGAVFVALIPLFALVFLFFGLRRGFASAALLRFGKLTRGRMVDKQPTNTQINNQSVYSFTFEFLDESGNAHRVEARTHHVATLEDEETEAIVYHPQRPQLARLVDAMPGKPKIVQDQVQPLAAGKVLRRLLFPVGGTLAHVAFALFWYVL